MRVRILQFAFNVGNEFKLVAKYNFLVSRLVIVFERNTALILNKMI